MRGKVDIDRLRLAIKKECAFHGFAPEVIMGKSRFRSVVKLRHMITYAIVDLYRNLPSSMGLLPTLSLQEIGILTGRDHASVMHIRNNVRNYIEVYDEERKMYEQIKSRMAITMGIDYKKEIQSPLDSAKEAWLNFRLAEKEYDITMQARYRKQLDELLGIVLTVPNEVVEVNE